ncbi:PQQ-binding-like beta-propeller repeat protein [Streptomyces ziwulingensis]|uniref:PQQ-binding-like beta-propeller repeat protein n=1 Tax=Streptomyces ziwulingensis TaxID=1045501 RepID=A0ABP9C8K6_9ACTN
MSQPPPPPPQPPQPPQQPPQPPQGGGGGFGPPQQPPPPGYGYPQQPAPSGYGYPGQPPAPAYGQQPGPNPYGQPTPPYGQQLGYAYPPPHTPYPTQPIGPGGPGGGRNRTVAVVVAAVVALALVVGGVVWFAHSSGDEGGKDDTATSGSTTGGGDEKGGTDGPAVADGQEKVPADPASEVLFQVPSPKVDKDERSVVVAGSWLTDKVYAKSGIAEITGYDPGKGDELWTIPLAGPVCTVSKYVTVDNKAAVVHQPAMPTRAKPSQGCSQVTLIDLDTGRMLWSKEAKAERSGDRPMAFSNVTVSKDTVAAGGLAGGVGWDISSGATLWSPKADDSCYDNGYGGGPKLVVVRKCGELDARQLHIQTIDPKTGKVVSEYEMAPGIEYAAVVSTDPLVVAADVGDSAGDGSGISDFFSLDNKTGKLRNRISAPGKNFAARCDAISRVEQCSGLTVGNDRLYIATEEHKGSGESYSFTNEIVVFDLATGKQTGERADAGDGYTMTPLRMDGGDVIAYKEPPYNKGGQVVSIDGRTFEETKLLENPATKNVRDVETQMQPEYAEIIYSQGRLYLAAQFASALSASDDKRYLTVAFGASG